MLKWVLGPGVVVVVGGGGIHSERGLESDWFSGHGFERGLVLPREMVGVVDSVDDWSFSYPLSLYASERSVASCSIVVMAARNPSPEVHCPCVDRPGMPKVLSSLVNTVSLRGPSVTGSR